MLQTIQRRVRAAEQSSTFSAAELWSAALFLAYMVVILLHRLPPSLGDFGDLIYQSSVLRRHMVGGVDPFHFVKQYPVPNGLATVGIGLLMLAVSWTAAAKLWLCGQFVLSWAVVRYFLRSVGHDGSLAWIVATAVFLNVNFWYGFVNFELSLCWAILLAAILYNGARWEWLCGVLLVLGFLSHMVPFALMALMLIAYAWQSRRARLLWQLAPSVILGLWYLYGRYYLSLDADGLVGMPSPIRDYSGAFWLFKVNSYLKSFGWVNPGTHTQSYVVDLLGAPLFSMMFLVNLVLAVVLGYAMLIALRRALRERHRERFIWVAALCFLPVYALGPIDALGISDPGSRVLQSVLAICLLLCAPSKSLRVAAVCTGLLAAGSLLLFARVAYSIPADQASARALPGIVEHFAHVPNHDKDEYLDALQHGDHSLAVFPTGPLLNTPLALMLPYHEQ